MILLLFLAHILTKDPLSFSAVNGFIKCPNAYICAPNDHYFAKNGKMKNAAVILNIILLIAVAVLFYLHFNPGKSHVNAVNNSLPKEVVMNDSTGSCRIAYFEMDSVEANFEMAKQWKNELEKKEDNINAQMNRLRAVYQDKLSSLKQHQSGMSTAQVEAATNDLNQLEENINNTKENLDQDYKSYYVQTQQEILTMIRKFCSEYNKDRKYAVIISDEPGLIFYKDSTFDITYDLLGGLNQMYAKKKADAKGK